MSASGEVETGRLAVSSDTAYQVEAGIARNELLVRLGFNRTLLTLQIQILGTAVAIFGVITQGRFQLPPRYIETACGVVLWISYALQSENIVNQSTISALAHFVGTVLNKKYGLKSSPEYKIWDWDCFLGHRHPESQLLKKLSLSLLSPSLILNLLLSGGSVAVLWITSNGRLFSLGRFVSTVVFSGLSANLLALYRFFKMEDVFATKKKHVNH